MELLNVEAVLFDFDGTVIDSYPGIQQAFDEAYFLTYAEVNNVSIQPYIGPPIDKILANVNNETDPDKIASFVSYFKNRYDTETYKSSVLYDGMKELLDGLYNNNIRLFIVTNKREKPTRLITDHLGIAQFFSGFYCSDSKEQYSSKAVIVNDLLAVESLDNKKCVLVGDTSQDEAAASQNDVPFVYAAFGYGNLHQVERLVNEPLEIFKFIKYIKG